MASNRRTKVQAEIEKARTRLAEQQTHIKELENKKTELENMEIVDIVRGLSIPLDDLSAVLQSLKGGAAPTRKTSDAPAPQSGSVAPKPSKSITEKSEKESKTE